MSYENRHTINLGKALLSQSQHRATRAINMIREYVQHHMHAEEVKIDEELAQHIWARGARSPPRKVTVEITDDEDDRILVGLYTEETKLEETALEKSDKPTDDSQQAIEGSTAKALAGSPKESTSVVGDVQTEQDDTDRDVVDVQTEQDDTDRDVVDVQTEHDPASHDSDSPTDNK